MYQTFNMGLGFAGLPPEEARKAVSIYGEGARSSAERSRRRRLVPSLGLRYGGTGALTFLPRLRPLAELALHHLLRGPPGLPDFSMDSTIGRLGPL